MMLKNFFYGCLFILGIHCCSAKEMKVLMIGNSFSVCVGKELPNIVNSVPDHKLELTSAYIGGCPLDRHSQNLLKAEKDPSFKPYHIKIWKSENPKQEKTFLANVNMLLKENRYDVITIQQGSQKSWNYATYQPFAEQLISYIRQHQPHAEIVIQQTWAYRNDHAFIQPNPKAKWKFDQNGMHERIREAYQKLAAAHQLRVIPMGEAVFYFRKYSPVKYRSEVTQYPALPSSDGDVVGKAWWAKKDGKYSLRKDCIHLNKEGNYLQACLWFSFLYDEPVTKIKYVPAWMKPEQAELIRRCVTDALQNYKQVK
ncbi:MAG: DUF4886 domain-containing protein [Lentisphaeria bacterium]|nr:DUF4886 domain-containing protein [Lentisphaeria bacterium]